MAPWALEIASHTMSVVHWILENGLLIQDIPISGSKCSYLEVKNIFAWKFLGNWMYDVIFSIDIIRKKYISHKN